jgi:hypothetical protein
MAQFIVRNSLNPNKAARFGVTFEQLVPKGYKGESIWVAEVATNEPHKDGGVIPPVFINLVSLDNLDVEMEKAVETISAKIDWTPLDEDLRPPFVLSCYPTNYEVGIESFVEIVIKDALPAAGIDIDSIKMVITADGKDFDVTNDLDITGDPFLYTIKWVPGIRVYDTF